MEQLDPQAVSLAKAIRQSESGGNFTAKGKSGEYGAYQFTEPTWNTYSKKFGVNARLQDSTPEQQNEVAYKQIKEWKDSGLNVGQIASMWNSGKPDAYLDPKYKGVNKYGVKYDVPAYAESVARTYQALKSGQNVGMDKLNPSSLIGTQTVEQPKKEGFLTSLAKGIVSPVATTIARPIQAGAELLGASAEDVNKATQQIAGDWVAPVPQGTKDVVKDIGRATETVALGLPAKGIIGAAKIGALAGAGAGLEKEGTLREAAKGAALGAGVGAIGGGISKALSENLPRWFVGEGFGLNDEQVAKVLSRKGWSPTSITAQSEKSIAENSNKIREIIAQADKQGVQGRGLESVQQTLRQLPDYTPEQLANEIKDLIPVKGGLIQNIFGKKFPVDRKTILDAVDRVIDGSASLNDKNLVKSALYNVSKKSYTNLLERGTKPAFSKGIAMDLADNLATEIKTVIPETEPMFLDVSKEIKLQEALTKIVKKTGTRGLIKYRDIIPLLGGFSLAGLPGALGGAAVMRFAESPAGALAAGKLTQAVGKATAPVVSRSGLLPGLITK